MEIIQLLEVSDEKWQTFVENCNECWLYHHSVFQDLDDPNCQSFAILEEERIVGGCILYVNRSGLGKVLGGRYGPAGLALLPGFSRRSYPLVNAHLKMLAHRHGCHAVQMGLPILAPAYRHSNYLQSHLYRLNFNNTLRWGLRTAYVPSFTTIIDLACSSEKIYSEFSESVRRDCARSSKVPFETEFLQGNVTDTQWELFLCNHQETMLRGQTQSLPKKLLDRLRALLERGYAALFNVNIAGKTVASLLLLTYKNSAFYFASGIQSEALNKGFSAQLHWSAVRELQERGYGRYEVGQFYPTLMGTKLGLLGEFKRRFGGIKRTVLAGELVMQEMRMLCLDLGPAYARLFAKNVYDIARGK